MSIRYFAISTAIIAVTAYSINFVAQLILAFPLVSVPLALSAYFFTRKSC